MTCGSAGKPPIRPWSTASRSAPALHAQRRILNPYLALLAGRQSCKICTCISQYLLLQFHSLYGGDARGCSFQRPLQVALAAQDMTENMTVETETAKTYREMRARDPAFDMIKFLRALKQDVQPVIQASIQPACLSSIYLHIAMLSVSRWHGCSCDWPALQSAEYMADCNNPWYEAVGRPVVLRLWPRHAQAYLKADADVLKQHCSPEAVERLTSIVKAEHAQVRITACSLSAGSQP